jgi:hypothetical protein
MHKKWKLFFIIFLSIIALIIIMIQPLLKEQYENEFDEFNKAELLGIIDKIEIKHHGVGFRLNNNANEFVFFPYTNKINNNKIINLFAKRGDSIIKSSFSDTLILIKDNKKYRYTFNKPSK